MPRGSGSPSRRISGDALTIAAVPITGGTPRVVLAGVLRGVPPLLLAIGPLALLPAESQESLPGARPGAGLEERDSREGDGLLRRRSLHRGPEDLAATARSSSTRAGGGRVTSSFCAWRSRRGTGDARPSLALASGSRSCDRHPARPKGLDRARDPGQLDGGAEEVAEFGGGNGARICSTARRMSFAMASGLLPTNFETQPRQTSFRAGSRMSIASVRSR